MIGDVLCMIGDVLCMIGDVLCMIGDVLCIIGKVVNLQAVHIFLVNSSSFSIRFRIIRYNLLPNTLPYSSLYFLRCIFSIDSPVCIINLLSCIVKYFDKYSCSFIVVHFLIGVVLKYILSMLL